MPPVPSADKLPRHVAIIMDGNGRWAKKNGLERLEGHQKGADVVRDITTHAREVGIQYLTLYSFSVQNWKRPKNEVAGLMSLLRDYCLKERKTLLENGIRLHTIGNIDNLPMFTRTALKALMVDTHKQSAMTLTLALDYGGREEIVRASRALAGQVERKEIAPHDIDEAAFANALWTNSLPDPDLVIRTSGETRISNFLLWQIAYAELFFTEKTWPEFDKALFNEALSDYARRIRRFGATDEQLDARSEEGSAC